ncbi:MAG: NAD-dependent epimerase/dehydratase family protein [Acidimicrobiia bacterium]|nr:NAD-dependent epimerase/dehydratase family protein [Acidimicrobiia bacterium]
MANEPSSWAESRVLISGGTGFLGSRLHERLAGYGASTALVVRPGRSSPIGGATEIGWAGNVADLVASATAFAPTHIFHVAAAGGADHNTTDIQDILDANVTLGTALLETAHRQQEITSELVPVVGTGTYSQAAEPAPEYRPNSLYAATKQAFDDIAEHYRSNESLPAIQLRLFDVYGPRDPRPRFLNLLADAVRTGKPLRATAGEQLVSFVHVEDVIDALLHSCRLVEGAPDRCKTYSVRGGELAPLRSTIERLIADVDAEVTIEWGARPYRRTEAMRPHAGETLPGWSPLIELADGFRELLGDI